MKHVFADPRVGHIVKRAELPARAQAGDIVVINGGELWRVVQCAFHERESAIVGSGKTEFEFECAILPVEYLEQGGSNSAIVQ